MSRISQRVPHMSRAESAIPVGNLAQIAPGSLAGYVLIAIDETQAEPVIVSDLDRPVIIAALAGILAVLTGDALDDLADGGGS